MKCKETFSPTLYYLLIRSALVHILFFYDICNLNAVEYSSLTKVPLEELIRSATLLVEALTMRRHYMEASNQPFPASLSLYLTNREIPHRILDQYQIPVDLNEALLNTNGEFTCI